ncbi:MAG: hypothetical protein WCJ35_23600 [Planctomycetota bacterium]
MGSALLLWLPYLRIHRSPRRWWFYAALLVLPVVFFVMLVEPICRSAHFHDATP